jgi:DNA-binding transcriptional regulator YdaS (Cro superfamily)
MLVDPQCIDRAKTRPAVLQATLALGFTDAAVARIIGVSQMTVSEWATGKRPIPKLRYAALYFFITRATGPHVLQGAIESASPGSNERRRLEATQQAVDVWRDLAFDEIDIDDLEHGLVTLGLIERDEINVDDLERGLITLGLIERPPKGRLRWVKELVNTLIGSASDAERSEIRAALVAEIDRIKEQRR